MSDGVDVDKQSSKLILSKFQELLAASPANNADWKTEALSLLRQTLSTGRQRKTTFSCGESDSEDSISEETKMLSIGVQTEEREVEEIKPTMERTVEELEIDWKKGTSLLPGDVLRLLNRGKAKQRELESRMEDLQTAVAVRRAFVTQNIQEKLLRLPFANYDYKYVINTCCENVIGYVPVPVGVAGPIKINGGPNLFVPMATTEGALIASTNRGCTAIMNAGGVSAHIYSEGMTRAPVVQFERASEAVKLKQWLDNSDNFDKVKDAFDSCSRFARLDHLEVRLDGCQAHIRFTARTGDAMGMNMISKASSQAIRLISAHFPTMKVLALSGNSCTDKKAAAINWISGRGRSVVADCMLPPSVVKTVLKTTPAALVEAARAKLESGSALAGTIGGGNAHAANIVAAIFIATGQDAAQVVSSSMCSTHFSERDDGSLYASCTLPCMEVGTVGGGTVLPAQNACLALLGVAGPSPSSCAPGTHAATLAMAIASTVLAGELSLMAALTTDDLVSSHLKLNRSRLNLYETSSSPIVTSSAGSTTLSVPHSGPIRGKSSERLGPKFRATPPGCSSIL